MDRQVLSNKLLERNAKIIGNLHNRFDPGLSSVFLVRRNIAPRKLKKVRKCLLTQSFRRSDLFNIGPDPCHASNIVVIFIITMLNIFAFLKKV